MLSITAKRLAKDGDRMLRGKLPPLSPALRKVAWAVADKIRERVQKRGKLGDGESYYADTDRTRYTSLEYAVDAGAKDAILMGRTLTVKVKVGELKRGKPFNAFSNTGGMWEKGLSVVRDGNAAKILFRGRSPGADIRWRGKRPTARAGSAADAEKQFHRKKRLADKRGPKRQRDTERRASSKRVNNNDKAVGIIDWADVNILMYTKAEQASIANALTELERRALAEMFPDGRWVTTFLPDDRELRRRIMSAVSVERV